MANSKGRPSSVPVTKSVMTLFSADATDES